MSALDDTVRAIVREELAAALASSTSTSDKLTIGQAAAHLGMSASWVRQRIRSGDLPATRLGRSVRVSRADLDRLGTRRQPGAETPTARALRIVGGGQ